MVDAKNESEVAIVGGGIHGTYLAYKLTEKLGKGSVTIIDPNYNLLEQWRKFTDNCGQTHLRSPDQHNLGNDADSLLRYASDNGRLDDIDSLSGYERPRIDLFNDHCDEIIDETGLEGNLLTGKVSRISSQKNSFLYDLSVSRGTIRARRVILALGQAGELNRAGWARGRAKGISHVFDEDFDIEDLEYVDRPLYVIGGGISAAQFAIKVAQTRNNNGKDGQVTLIARTPPRIAELDARALWTRQDYIRNQFEDFDFDEREELVEESKNKGTIPGYVHEELMKTASSANLKLRVDEIKDVRKVGDRYKIEFASGAKELFDGNIVLATGFGKPKKNKLLEQISKEFKLGLTESGFPKLRDDLQWGNGSGSGIYVSGDLASLTLGPLAGNIRGAQMAGELILNSLS